MIITDEDRMKEIVLNQINNNKDDNILINLINCYLVDEPPSPLRDLNEFLEKCQTDTLIFNFLGYVLRRVIDIKKYLAQEIKIFEILQPKLRSFELTLRQFKELRILKDTSQKNIKQDKSGLRLEDFPIFFKLVLSVFNYSYFNFFKTDIYQDLLKLGQMKELSALFDFIKKNKEHKLIRLIEDKVPEYASIMYSIESIAFREDNDEEEDPDANEEK